MLRDKTKSSRAVQNKICHTTEAFPYLQPNYIRKGLYGLVVTAYGENKKLAQVKDKICHRGTGSPPTYAEKAFIIITHLACDIHEIY